MIKAIKANVNIKSKKKLFLTTAGEHTSLFSGDGLDFKEIRQYVSGDDIRHINWKVTARKRDTNVNVFNEDKQINIVLVYLNSGSIYFGSHKSKQETMIEVLSTLGFSALKKNDLLSTLFFSSKEEKFFKQSKNIKMLDVNIDTALNLNPLGKNIDYKKLNHYLLSKIKQKSLIFIIGDFLQIPNFLALGKKHEVYCAIVRDKLEEELNLSGEFNFINTNDGENKEIYLDENSIQKYNSLMKEHDRKLFAMFKKANIKASKIYTHQNSFKQLLKLVRG
jgi:uncharacterized protein (DUF58 family)